MGDEESYGDTEHRMKELKTRPVSTFTANVAVTDYFLFQSVVRTCKWPQSITFASHSHTQMGHKERKWFQTGTRDPRKLGSGCAHTPLSSGAAAPGNRLLFPQRRTHNLLPHTHQHTRAKQALPCIKMCKHTHTLTDEHTFTSVHTHMYTCIDTCLSISHYPNLLLHFFPLLKGLKEERGLPYLHHCFSFPISLIVCDSDA